MKTPRYKVNQIIVMQSFMIAFSKTDLGSKYCTDQPTHFWDKNHLHKLPQKDLINGYPMLFSSRNRYTHARYAGIKSR